VVRWTSQRNLYGCQRSQRIYRDGSILPGLAGLLFGPPPNFFFRRFERSRTRSEDALQLAPIVLRIFGGASITVAPLSVRAACSRGPLRGFPRPRAGGALGSSPPKRTKRCTPRRLASIAVGRRLCEASSAIPGLAALLVLFSGDLFLVGAVLFLRLFFAAFGCFPRHVARIVVERARLLFARSFLIRIFVITHENSFVRQRTMAARDVSSQAETSILTPDAIAEVRNLLTRLGI
jgi:hypothetical protein